MSAAEKSQFGLNPSFTRKVELKDAMRKRLAERIDQAEAEATKRLETARQDVERMLAEVRAEAEAILASLPDFAAIEAAPATAGRSAMAAIRAAADKRGLPLAVVVGRSPQNPTARRARDEAVCNVADACPDLSLREIGLLFSGISVTTVSDILKRRPPR